MTDPLQVPYRERERSVSMERVERLNVKTRVGIDNATVQSVTDLFPTANFQEREVYEMFGIIFRGHPDLRRLLLPELYAGWPQRRDFPIGGEPIFFTHNEPRMPRYTQ